MAPRRNVEWVVMISVAGSLNLVEYEATTSWELGIHTDLLMVSSRFRSLLED